MGKSANFVDMDVVSWEWLRCWSRGHAFPRPKSSVGLWNAPGAGVTPRQSCTFVLMTIQHTACPMPLP